MLTTKFRRELGQAQAEKCLFRVWNWQRLVCVKLHLIIYVMAARELGVGDGKIVACASIGKFKTTKRLGHRPILIRFFPMGERPTRRRFNQIKGGRRRIHARNVASGNRFFVPVVMPNFFGRIHYLVETIRIYPPYKLPRLSLVVLPIFGVVGVVAVRKQCDLDYVELIRDFDILCSHMEQHLRGRSNSSTESTVCGHRTFRPARG